MPQHTPRGDVVLDLYGDGADLFPRTNYLTGETDGVHLTVAFDDPDGNRLDFDLDGAKKLRDSLTRIIDDQTPQKDPEELVRDLINRLADALTAVEQKKEAGHGNH